MGTKNLLKMLLLLSCTIGFTSCDNEDNGSRAFMHKATIIGDSKNGYYCYLDGGGLVISYDQRLTGIERGYFAFNYMEDNWETTADNKMYINNAHVYPYSVYDVIYPITIEEAESKSITHKDSCFIPPFLSLGYGYRGYFELNTGLSIVNLINGEKVFAKLNIVYDPAKQTPDTLLLHFYYNPRIPEKWSNTSFDYGSVSCDISSLATIKQWSDSITVVVEAADERRHLTKISKNDLFKPDTK